MWQCSGKVKGCLGLAKLHCGTGRGGICTTCRYLGGGGIQKWIAESMYLHRYIVLKKMLQKTHCCPIGQLFYLPTPQTHLFRTLRYSLVNIPFPGPPAENEPPPPIIMFNTANGIKSSSYHNRVISSVIYESVQQKTLAQRTQQTELLYLQSIAGE